MDGSNERKVVTQTDRQTETVSGRVDTDRQTDGDLQTDGETERVRGKG